MQNRVLRVVIVGHVDHGKSTLVGRLLHDTGHLSEAKVAEMHAAARRRGMRVEWAFALDALQAERDQAITIDATQVWFSSKKRPYCIVDAPGHKEFLKNMVTGASSADAALLLIDAAERIQEQSRQHAYLLHLLGITQVAVVVNKMDIVEDSEHVFRAIETPFLEYLERLGIVPRAFIPISAADGTNLVKTGERMSWYQGPSILEALDSFEPPEPPADLPLRMPLQGVYKFDDRRLLAGRVESGSLKVGDRVLFSPCDKISTVKSVERFAAEPLDDAVAGECVAVRLTEQVFVQRGEILSHLDEPPIATNVLEARLFWLSRIDLEVGARHKLRVATQEVEAWVERIHHLVDAETLENAAHRGDRVRRNEVAEVTIRTAGPVALDSHDRLPATGRFVLIADGHVAGGGICVLARDEARRELFEIKSGNISWSESQVTREARQRRNGHRGMVVWLTGLSGAGKSTLANALERELFRQGHHTYVLDGDNVRHGLNRNLGFSHEDRTENIRRIGEVAKLFADAGTIVVTAFISPYRQDREMIRSLLGEGEFYEIFVSCPLEECERRDPKGLYHKVRKGEIKGFTGIDAPYEEPETPELVVRTDQLAETACVEEMLRGLEEFGAFDP